MCSVILEDLSHDQVEENGVIFEHSDNLVRVNPIFYCDYGIIQV